MSWRTFAALTAPILVACSGQGGAPVPTDADQLGRDARAASDASPSGAEAGGASAGKDAAVHSPADASSTDSARPEPLTRDEFVRVTTDFSGGFCDPRCALLKRSVEAGAVLVLEDDKGVERFELSPEEYESVLAIVLDPAFLQALGDPSDCHPELDVGTTIQVVAKGVGPLMDSGAASCINGRTASDHIYNRLAWLLIDLQKAHLDCSADTPSAAKPGRSLCNVCNVDTC